MFYKEDKTMKKILAGILASASLMATALSASASSYTPESYDSKVVSKAGEVTYDVAVTAPKVVLNITLPAKMKAALNPYGAEIALSTANKSTKGIASVAYEVTNSSKDYGVYLDGTAITTVTTSDTTKWKVTGTSVTAGTKGACMSLLALDSLEDDPVAETSKAFTSGKGSLLLDSTVAANATNGTVEGQTSQKKFGYVAAATESTATQKIYLVFAGDLAKSGTGSTPVEVEWKDDDAINVNLVLKVTAGPKTLS